MFPIVQKAHLLMAIELYEHQLDAIERLRNGSILVGGVGSGKSRTALAYYIKECGGKIKINGKGGYVPMKSPKNLYIITTARKRDTLEWERECIPFLLSTHKECNIEQVAVTIDSWNNINKYTGIKQSFFIFDEQRVIGSGVWVKAFLKITQTNNWILLSATPGDSWMDYVPVFIANKFYKNRTEFLKRHVIYNRFTKYPKIERYIDVKRLINLRDSVCVTMKYKNKTKIIEENIIHPFNKELFNQILIKRWNIFENRPITSVTELCYLLRKIVNSDNSRLKSLLKLYKQHLKIVIFYYFNYERDLLLDFAKENNIIISEWNGHKHELIPDTEKWLYIVQYTSGCEGWNCVETNTIIFYSQHYSYKTMIQAAGRINRLNTPYSELNYYYFKSNSVIDLAIQKAFLQKKDFNESRFLAI